MTFPWLVLGVLGTAIVSAALARATRQYFVAAVAGASCIVLLHGWFYFHYTSDDAYISFRYARNFADGLGIVWNPGEHVEGYSNFLWVLALSGMSKAGADIVLSARWIGFAFGVASIAGTYALTRALAGGEEGRPAGLAAALLLAAAGPFALWALAGLESAALAMLILGAVLLHLREREGAIPASGAVWAFASMTRPEVPLLVAVSGAFKLGDLPAARRDRRLRRELLRLAVWAAGFAVLFVPYFAWRWAGYDYFFPNTYYAKVGAGLDQYERGLRYAATFAREYAVWLVLLAPVAAALAPARRVPLLYVLALVVAWIGYVVYVGGDSLVRFRFFAPVMPLAYALVAAAVAVLAQAVRFERPQRRAAEGALALAGVGLLLFTLQASATDVNLAPERQAVEDRAEIGRWLRRSVPADTMIAVIPAGAIPFESRLWTIDMLGINDEHIAHRDVPLGVLAAGHEKFDTEYVLDRRPDIIILEDVLTEMAWSREDYATLNTGLIPARIDMLGNERLWREYEARSVEVEEGSWFNLLVRRDASAVLERTQAPLP